MLFCLIFPFTYQGLIMKLTKAIQSITEMLDKCPECGSDNIANEDQASDAGLEISSPMAR
jgi:hypothetical protein